MENSTALEQAAGKRTLPLDALADVVSSLESVERVLARMQAVREGLLAMASQLAVALEDDDGSPSPGGQLSGWRPPARELAERAVAAEIAAAIRMSDRTVQRQMGQAVELVDRFPAVFQALSEGRISLAHARIIQDAGAGLFDDGARARYQAAVLDCAERQAPSRLRRSAAREAEKTHPEALTVRRERAVAGRCVRVHPLPDGMAELAATLPAAVAYGIHDRLTHMAKTHTELAQSQAETAAGTGPAADGTDGTTRTMDQLRADLLADMLLRGAPTAHDTPDGLLAAITARVDVTVPVLTLIDGPTLGADYVPAELNGRHPIDPETAKLLAGQVAAWNRVLTEPFTGTVLAVNRYRPGEDIKRLLTARDTRCRFPGCGIPARDLDLDHTKDAAHGGPTNTQNLAGLCRRHHMLKHHSNWTVRQTSNGVLVWTSPTGRTYEDSPPTPATHIGGLPRSSTPDSHRGGEPPF